MMTRATNTNLNDQLNALPCVRWNAAGHRAAALISMMLVLNFVLITAWTCDVSWADDPIPQQMAVGYQNGTITAIYERTFQIDGRTYSFTPDAVIVNDKGVEIEASVLTVTAEVKYHVKKEQEDKIDRMILFLPR